MPLFVGLFFGVPKANGTVESLLDVGNVWKFPNFIELMCFFRSLLVIFCAKWYYVLAAENTHLKSNCFGTIQNLSKYKFICR
jgi:hypothetical protein